MCKYVIKANIITDNLESDLLKLSEIFGNKINVTYDTLKSNWEDIYDGYEQI